MSDADADAFEEALFDAPDDADLALLDRIARHGATLVEHGSYEMGTTREHIDALIAAGHKVHIFDAGPPGTSTVPTFGADVEFVVSTLRFGRTDLERVDVELNIVDHGVQKTVKDALVDRSDGSLHGLCERPLAEMAFRAGRVIINVRKRDGARDILATWDLTPAP
jgi:hypothetical protein